MSKKITIKHKDYCDGCSELENLNTLGGHKKCKVYKKVMLPSPSLEIESRGLGTIKRPDECKVENVAEVKPR